MHAETETDLAEVESVEEDQDLPESLKLRLALPVPSPKRILLGNMFLLSFGLGSSVFLSWSVAAAFITISLLFTLSAGSAYLFAFMQRKAELLAQAEALDAAHTRTPSKLAMLEAQEAVLDKLIYGDEQLEARGTALWGHRPRALATPDSQPGVVICMCPKCGHHEHRWTTIPDVAETCTHLTNGEPCGAELRNLRGPVECPNCGVAVFARTPAQSLFCPRCNGCLFVP